LAWSRRNSGKARVVVTGSQIFLAREIDADGEQHADPSRGKAVMPADFLPERPDNERGQDHAGVNPEIENLKGIGAPEIFGFIKRTDLAGDVALEHADTDDQAKKREQKCGLESHQEMPGRHDERAQQNGAAPAEETIGEEAAKDRGEINGGRIGAEDRGGERLAIKTEVEFAETGERRDVLDPPRLEEVVDHVEDEERLHPVIGKALPRFGEGEEPESARMPEETGLVFFAGQRRGVIGLGSGAHEGRS
jgi:hypothetical protein